MKTRTTRIKPISDRRSRDAASYRNKVRAFLEAHPYCQYEIAQNGLDEADVIANRGVGEKLDPTGTRIHKIRVARAVQVHHRNKRTGRRLLDERFWLAVARENHDVIEQNKGWARGAGYLLPIQADENGHWGKGNRGLTTEELLTSKRR